MTRRLLARLVAAGAAAAALSATLVVLPTTGPTQTSIPAPTVTRTGLTGGGAVGGGWSTTVRGNANLVGLQWDGDPAATFAVERRTPSGAWRSVGTAQQTDVLPDRGSPDARGAAARTGARHATDPVWVGTTDEVRIRLVSGTARGVKLDRVVAPPARTSAASAGAAVPGRPGIVTRPEWGADESLRLSNCPGGPDYDAEVKLAIVHHTDNANDYSPAEAAQLVRSIYAYHTVSLGYCDIAYNFLIDRFGTVYEGRYGGIAKAVHGAHSIGFNTATTGIALIGNYQVGAPSAAQIDALDATIAWKLAMHGVDPGGETTYTTAGNDKFAPGTTLVLPTVIGHRDTWFTDCPGQNLEALLPDIRANAAARVAAAPPSYWHAWDPLGGSLKSGPAAVSWQPGRLDTFVRGADDQLWHRWFDGGWSGWEPLGGVLTSDPAAVSWVPGHLDVYVRGSDNRLWHRWYSNGWSPWLPVGGTLASGPAAVSWAPYRTDVFVRGTDDQLWHTAYVGGFTAWEPLGGSLTTDPAVASWAPGRLDVFVRGTDTAVWHRFYAGGWSGWESLGGSLTSAPAAASWTPGRIDVFGRGTDNALYQRFYVGSGWSGWGSLGGTLSSSPDVASWQPGRLDVFAGGNGAALWHRAFSNDLYP